MKKISITLSLFLATIIIVRGQDGMVGSTTGSNAGSTTTSKKEKIFYPTFHIVLPMNTSWVHATAISPIIKPSDYRLNYGKISSFGYGVGVEAKVYSNVRVFADMTFITYKQELAEKDATGVHHSIGTGGTIDLPLGAKYKTKTLPLRIGAKYVYSKSPKLQPWISLAYGLNFWNVKYVTWDEDKEYGVDTGTTGRLNYGVGLDVITKEISVTFFFDANAPVADYTMKDLFGVGDFSQFDGMTFPNLRFGISLSGL